MSKLVGQSIEDYVKSIYLLSEMHEMVAANALSEAMGVSPAAVTKMGKRLQEMKLVRYSRQNGFRLTTQGRAIALEMVRHHRLLEMYLHQALGYTWDKVHDEAEVLEHVISEEFEERIDALLGYPTHDPHGAPIPTRDGKIETRNFPSLNQLEMGEDAVIRRVTNRDSTMLNYIGSLGLYPGTEIRLLGMEPYGGSLSIEVGDKTVSVGSVLANHIFVETTGRRAGTTNGTQQENRQ